DRTRLLHALDERAASMDDIVLEGANAAEGRDPAGLVVETILHRDRHAVQGTDLVAARERGFSRLGRLPRIIEPEDDQCIDLRVVGLDALDGAIHHLDWRHLLATDP